MSTDVDCHSVGSQGKIEFCLPKVKCHFITILSKPELAMISSVIPTARKEALSACVHPSAIVRRKSRSLAAFFSCSLSLFSSSVSSASSLLKLCVIIEIIGNVIIGNEKFSKYCNFPFRKLDGQVRAMALEKRFYFSSNLQHTYKQQTTTCVKWKI